MLQNGMDKVMAAAGWAGLTAGRPLVMGILNVTPDSFSDGGRFADADAAIAAGLRMVDDGADILDVGGESTRPGAVPVAIVAEIGRVVPVVAALAAAGALVSIDTRNARTMTAALTAGARIVNDVSALRHDAGAAGVVAAAGCPVILMHSRGTPETMNSLAVYGDVVAAVLAELLAARDAAVAAGVPAGSIALDPGLGFAKTSAQNLALLRATTAFARLGHPLVVGASRKRFVGELTGVAAAADRMAGSLAAALYAAARGATILRVHDVAETVQALRLWRGLAGEDECD